MIDPELLEQAFKDVAEENLKRIVRDWIVTTAPPEVKTIYARYEELLRDKKPDFDLPNNPEKYSEEYEAFYNEETNEWLESKCDDPTCHYCLSRPEKPLEELKRHDWEAAVKKMNRPL